MLWPIFVPSAMSATAQQAISVLLPLFFLDLGLGAALASAAVGMRGLGMIAGDLPAGDLAARRGDRFTIVSGLIALSVATLGLVVFSDARILSALMVAYGVATSFYLVGRLSYITDTVPNAERGRVIACLAGLMRLGSLVGPITATYLVVDWGFRWVFCLMSVMFFAASIIVVRNAASIPAHERHAHERMRIIEVVRRHSAHFLTAGYCSFILMTMRAAKTVSIPLIGNHLGLPITTIGLVVSVAAVIDLAFFYPAGEVMDRRGRKFSLIPGLALMSSGFVALSAADSYQSFFIAAGILGLANGWSTGVVMTMGSDLGARLTPAVNRSRFIGVWRIAADLGAVVGPLVVALMILWVDLAAAVGAIALLGVSGFLVALFAVEETLVREASGE